MAAGTYTFTIQAEVNTGNTPKPTGQRTYTVTIAAAPLVFTHSPDYDVPAGTVGTAITPIDVSGGASGGSTPYKFSLETCLAGFPSLSRAYSAVRAPRRRLRKQPPRSR